MHFIEPAIFILLFASLSLPIANRFHLPFEIFLIIGSCIVSLSPWFPTFQLNPDIVFKLFLPPILFYAAYFTSWKDFKFNLRPISLLAFGLVIFTMLFVAFVAKKIIPGFSWAESFLLGAIVSPTDATSAIAIMKKIGVPRRIITILEGEGMVNDATALILFRFSLAAILGGTFSFTYAASQFAFLSVGGIAVGLITGVVFSKILPKIQSETAEATLTIITAFVAYLIAEYLGVSAIISTVVCGIYFGIQIPEVASSSTRIQAKASWNTLIFVINGLVFTLIGLELPLILKNLQSESVQTLIYYGLTISVIVMLARILWVYPMAYIPRFFFSSIERKDPMPSWKTLFILSWSGMRGIVSLAAALSIPFFLPSGQHFPHRDLIILITYFVIIVTLITPTVTFPFILRYFKLVDDVDEMKQEALARIRSLENSINRSKNLIKDDHIPDEISLDFITHLEKRLDVIKTQIEETPYSTLSNDFLMLRKLVHAAIDYERTTLLELRKNGEIHDEVFHRLSDELDIEEMRAKTIRI